MPRRLPPCVPGGPRRPALREEKRDTALRYTRCRARKSDIAVRDQCRNLPLRLQRCLEGSRRPQPCPLAASPAPSLTHPLPPRFPGTSRTLSVARLSISDDQQTEYARGRFGIRWVRSLRLSGKGEGGLEGGERSPRPITAPASEIRRSASTSPHRGLEKDPRWSSRELDNDASRSLVENSGTRAVLLRRMPAAPDATSPIRPDHYINGASDHPTCLSLPSPKLLAHGTRSKPRHGRPYPACHFKR